LNKNNSTNLTLNQSHNGHIPLAIIPIFDSIIRVVRRVEALGNG